MKSLCYQKVQEGITHKEVSKALKQKQAFTLYTIIEGIYNLDSNRKPKYCPIPGCRTAGKPLKKLPNHTAAMHPELSKKARLDALKSAKVALKPIEVKISRPCPKPRTPSRTPTLDQLWSNASKQLIKCNLHN